MAAKDFHILVRQPQRMGCNHVRAEESEALKIFHGRHSVMGSLAIKHLLLRFAQMDMQLKPVFCSKAGSPDNGFLTD